MRPRERRALSATLAGLLAALLVAGRAHARLPAEIVPSALAGQKSAKLAVLVVPTASHVQGAAARFRFIGQQVVERTGRFQFLSAADELDPQNARARRIRLEEATAALHAARAAYDELDTARALAHANRAIQAFGETDVSAHFGYLGAALILRIASMVANGEKRAAEMEIDRLIAIQPSAQFSPNFFPPEVIAYAERSRKSAMTAGETLEVRTVPPGAEIYVNAQFRGISPVTVTGVAQGDHYVTACLPGYGLAQQQTRPGNVELTLKVAERYAQYQAAVDRIAKNPGAKPRDDAAREYGAQVGADQVLVVILEAAPGATQARLIGLRLDPKDGHNFAYRSEMVPVDVASDQAEGFVAALVGADDPRRGGPVTHYQALDPAGLRRMAGLGLMGLGVIAGVVGAVFGSQATSTHAEWLSTPQASAQSEALESTGKLQAAMADVSFILAALAAGGGGFLVFSRDLGEGSPSGMPHAATPPPATPIRTAVPEASAAAETPARTPPPEIAPPADSTGKAKSARNAVSDDARATGGDAGTKKAVDKKKKKKKRRAMGENLRGAQ